MASDPKTRTTAIWAITKGGFALAGKIARELSGCTLFIPSGMGADTVGAMEFDRIGDGIKAHFNRYDRHLFIMAAGIVVRTIAPQLVHKTKDPAVVVMDEKGAFAVSLVSGHIGGANEFARKVAKISNGQAVITTATDVNRVPAIDLIAVKKHLYIENPGAIKYVNMALIEKTGILLHDPYGFLEDELPAGICKIVSEKPHLSGCINGFGAGAAGIWVDDIDVDLPRSVLVLRPLILVAGIGCNRNTGMGEIDALLRTVLDQYGLSIKSLKAVASVDLKADEKGLVRLSKKLGVPFQVFSRDRLNSVKNVTTPSRVVEKHIGVKSVCEAAAILATGNGQLVVSKQKTKNVTVALARDVSLL